jgi:hypothetical protein
MGLSADTFYGPFQLKFDEERFWGKKAFQKILRLRCENDPIVPVAAVSAVPYPNIWHCQEIMKELVMKNSDQKRSFEKKYLILALDRNIIQNSIRNCKHSIQ